ncbi:hypothetical protein [Halomontanus rarus]|uniref:hypothetical protein n=1 Tax=Halomontanus rarus TaxID=3034020 RepID=UPI0023E88BF4|nr:hypothetical protein [Halovivax sp. TS33]
MTDERNEIDSENGTHETELELGKLYWDTHRWKTYAPYREDEDLVYMVTVRHKSEVADALSGGSLVAHEDRLADSQFDQLDAIESFRARAADEAHTVADLMANSGDGE